MPLRKVAKTSDVTPGQGHVVQLDDLDLRIALFQIEGEITCIEDVCTHDDGPLAEGELEGEVIQCPRHGAKFNVKSGAVLSMPAVTPVRSFPVEVRDGDIYVDLPEEG